MKKLILLLSLSTGIISYSSAQVVSDAGLWCTFNLEKKLTDKFGLFLTEEYRLRENFSQNNLFYTELGFYVKPAEFMKVSLSYRNIQKFIEDEAISFRHRVSLDVNLKKKVGMLNFGFRQRLQTEYRNVYSSDLGNVPEWYTRSKLQIKFDLDKAITPYVACELRYQIKNARAVPSDGLWHRIRYIGGLDYKRNDRNTFGLYYLVQNEWNVSSPQRQYIIGLEYTLSL